MAMTDDSPTITQGDIGEYLRSLTASPRFGPQIVARRDFPHQNGSYADFPADFPEELIAGMQTMGLDCLYSHQRQALDLIREGKNVIVATPTASGKSMIYNLAVFEKLLANQASQALYLFPLKALAQDQLRVLRSFSSHLGVMRERDQSPAAIYDGDTSPYQRTKIRKKTPPILISNPDMLHLSFLPYHENWSHFFKNLETIVLDEVHTYRGVFGSHMSWVIRRLLRIANHYGANPVVIMLSATIGNPDQFGETLLSRPVELVSRSGAPSARKQMILFDPWDSAAHTVSQMVEAAVKRDLRTIVYTQSRKMTELITLWTRPRLGENSHKLSSYRAGFLP